MQAVARDGGARGQRGDEDERRHLGDDGRNLGDIDTAAPGQINDRREDKQPEDVIDDRGAENGLTFDAIELAETPHHANGDRHARGNHGGADEQRFVL